MEQTVEVLVEPGTITTFESQLTGKWIENVQRIFARYWRLGLTWSVGMSQGKGSVFVPCTSHILKALK